MTTIIGPGVSTPTANKIRSTYVYGTFGNFDKSDGTIQAYAAFQRNVLVAGNLILGTEILDASGNAIDSSSNIMFTLNKTAYSIPLKTLSYIKNVTSDIQTQITNISASAGNISSVGFITQNLPDITSTQFGLNAFNKTLLSTANLYNSAFGGNTLYNNTTGNFNTCVGHSSAFANTTGSCLTAVGQQALAKNISGNYNTAVGFLSSVDNLTGSGNTSVGGFSLLHNSIGSYNTAIGFFSNQTNTTGNSNSSTGYQALDKNTTGNNNCAFGYSALSNNTTGSSNVCLGSAAGQSMTTATASSCVGENSDTSFSYSTSIGSNSVCTADHQITLGTANESVNVPGNITVAGSINNISNTVFGYLSNVSANHNTKSNKHGLFIHC